MGVPSLRAIVKTAVDVIQTGKPRGYLSNPITEKGESYRQSNIVQVNGRLEHLIDLFLNTPSNASLNFKRS
ncbi:MAG UNVERIFIED_CONTAM: hypothetical protein LVR29_19405 [Microcystis novacekii LVE1205-3]|jgi:hypothetical protein